MDDPFFSFLHAPSDLAFGWYLSLVLILFVRYEWNAQDSQSAPTPEQTNNVR